MNGAVEAELPTFFEFIRNGMNVKQNKEVSGLPITRIETIWNGEVDQDRFGYAGLLKPDVEKWLLKRGDILFSHINSVEHVGKCAIFDLNIDVVHGMNLLCFRPRVDRANSSYLKWLFRSKGFRAQILPYINKAVNQASISIGNLSAVKVRMPPIDEQKRIATILDEADELRRKRQCAIMLINQLGQAIFHEMFGLISDLKSAQIKEVAKVSTGSTPPTSEEGSFGGPVPFVTPGDLGSGTSVKRSLTDQGARKSRTVQAGATLVCCIGATIGKMDRANSFSAFNQQINAIEWGDEIDPTFGYFATQQLRSAIIHKGKGASTTLPILKKSEFEKLAIAYPKKELQVIFSDRIAEVETSQSRLLSSKERLDTLFDSLQARAFKGEL